MKNILIELAYESDLPITSRPRVELFDELSSALSTEDSVRLSSLKSSRAIESKELIGAKNQIIRMAKLGILELKTALLSNTGDVIRLEDGAVKLSDLSDEDKPVVFEVDFVVSMSESTKKKLSERSGVDSSFVVSNQYVAKTDPSSKSDLQSDFDSDLVSSSKEDSKSDAPPSEKNDAVFSSDEIPSMESLDGEVPRRDLAESLETETGQKERLESIQQKVRQTAQVIQAKSEIRLRKVAAYTLGILATIIGVVVAIKTTQTIDDKVTSIERQISEPAEGLRVVKMSEIEGLYATIEKLKAEKISLLREGDMRVSSEKAKMMEEMTAKRAEIERESYEKGRTEAVGLSVSLRERVAAIAKKHVILTGGCEAIGRGNRIDRIYLDGYGAHVKYWLVDPTDVSVAGVVATNEKLMDMKDGAVVEVRCYGGESKMTPAAEMPVKGSDGKSHAAVPSREAP
jgi:hypothetical protein